MIIMMGSMTAGRHSTGEVVKSSEPQARDRKKEPGSHTGAATSTFTCSGTVPPTRPDLLQQGHTSKPSQQVPLPGD